jgi:hypothetical protein
LGKGAEVFQIEVPLSVLKMNCAERRRHRLSQRSVKNRKVLRNEEKREDVQLRKI